MPKLTILVDGHEFEAEIKAGATAADLEKAADELRANLSRLSGLSFELSGGAFLVLGEKQLEQTIFVFTP